MMEQIDLELELVHCRTGSLEIPLERAPPPALFTGALWAVEIFAVPRMVGYKLPK